ncbi:MAG: addiction module protein [Planctomycetes bacterium]|nr:addiction module protein [Planctomycetota bacterium]
MLWSWDELRKLSIEDRLRLIETIWESIEEDRAPTEISDELKQELHARWAEHLRDPSKAIDWEFLRRSYRLEP